MPPLDEETIERSTTTAAASDSTLDRLTGTTSAKREELMSHAKERVAEAMSTALEAIRSNPKTAAAIAAGATAAVAGSAYGAKKLSAKSTASGPPKTRKAPARRSTKAKS